MSKKLFVGCLSWDTTDDGLREAFSRFGSVIEAKVVTDRETGRSRGFGFVGYQDPSDGAAAQQARDGASLDGRSIRVNAAEDKPGGGGGSRGGGGGGGYGGGGGGGRW
jgi:RNA recognition motif-containing protein